MFDQEEALVSCLTIVADAALITRLSCGTCALSRADFFSKVL